jgi:hypothetical protein
MVRIDMQLHPDEAELVWQALHEAKRQLRAGGADEATTHNDGTDIRADTAADLSVEGAPSGPTLADAAVALAEHRLVCREHADARPGGERRQLLIHVREDKLQAGRLCAELHDGTPLSGETLLRLACDCGISAVKTDTDGNVLDVGRKRRTPSPALMRALLTRDRTCAFPGCECEAYLEAHHIEHWAQGGETSLSNTTLLCWACHTRVHEGGFFVEQDDDGQLCFFDPDGVLIQPAPQPPPVESDVLDVLSGQQRATGIHIDHRIALPDWDGRRLDLHAAVGALAVRRSAPRRTCGPHREPN